LWSELYLHGQRRCVPHTRLAIRFPVLSWGSAIDQPIATSSRLQSAGLDINMRPVGVCGSGFGGLWSGAAPYGERRRVLHARLAIRFPPGCHGASLLTSPWRNPVGDRAPGWRSTCGRWGCAGAALVGCGVELHRNGEQERVLHTRLAIRFPAGCHGAPLLTNPSRHPVGDRAPGWRSTCGRWGCAGAALAGCGVESHQNGEWERVLHTRITLRWSLGGHGALC